MNKPRFKKDHNIDGWPILDTKTEELFSKDGIVEALNSYEELANVLEAEVERLEEELREILHDN